MLGHSRLLSHPIFLDPRCRRMLAEVCCAVLSRLCCAVSVLSRAGCAVLCWLECNRCVSVPWSAVSCRKRCYLLLLCAVYNAGCSVLYLCCRVSSHALLSFTTACSVCCCAGIYVVASAYALADIQGSSASDTAYRNHTVCSMHAVFSSGAHISPPKLLCQSLLITHICGFLWLPGDCAVLCCGMCHTV